MKKLSCLLIIFLPSIALADWQGIVIGISDGDTVTALSPEKKPVKIRMVEIDAPEKKQDFGQKSKQSLSDICYKKTVTVKESGKDKYGRTLARLICDGIDANAEQVRRGMAWAYLKYLTDPAIAGLEKQARINRVGLWSDNNAQAPWLFRHAKRR